MAREFDAIVVGGGHNGLVAATMLGRAGYAVLVLERRESFGGAAVSAAPFPGVDVRLSQFSYLVSLFPRALVGELGLKLELRQRRVSSYTPDGDAGVLISDDAERTRQSLRRTLGDDRGADQLRRLGALTGTVAAPLFASLTEPLGTREELRARLDAEDAWHALMEQPLSRLLEQEFDHDLIRGIVATDALIGTFARLDDPGLLQNRCFLYHVIGNGTGRWDVPVGGMGALAIALEAAARDAGADLRSGAPVVAAESDSQSVAVRTEDGTEYRGRHLLSGAAPAVLAELLGDPQPGPTPEGSQLKLNMVLARLPRLRDPSISPEEAFAGTFHVNEGYEQLQRAFDRAAEAAVPDLPPCEAYCHSLTDPSILGPELRQAGAQTLTVFGLHMPARCFADEPERAKADAVSATLASLNSVLDEPLQDCLWRTPEGEPCLEARTPPELEDELGLPAGHIFHRDLAWPFAESDAEAGRWGVETARPNVWVCGAGARRGGGVSGIAGHNAARAVLDADRRQSST